MNAYVQLLHAILTCTQGMAQAVEKQDWERLTTLTDDRQRLINQADEQTDAAATPELMVAAEPMLADIARLDEGITAQLRNAMDAMQTDLNQASEARSSAKAYLKTTILPQPVTARFVDNKQ